MPFIQTSTVTNSIAKLSTKPIGNASLGSTIFTQPQTSIVGINGPVGVGSALQTITKVKSVTNVVGSLIGASDFVRSAIQSTLSTFDKSANSLATGINSKLANIFKNTNVVSASNVPTQISDPVTTNLLNKNKKPGSTSFKVTGIGEGSQSATTGQVTQGTGASQMTGATIGTLLTRFKQDIASVKQLSKTITNTLSTQKLSGLFNLNLKSLVNSSLAPVVLSNLTPDTKSAVSTVLGLVKGKDTNVNTNDYNDFLGQTNGLSRVTGDTDLSQYYTQSTGYSLITRDGNPINTGDSRPDAATANTLTNMLRSVGCNLTNPEYLSADTTNSLFGLGLLLAGLENMLDLVDDLLNCSHATTPLGQQSLKTVYTDLAPVNPSIAVQVIDKIDNPELLATPALGRAILLNPKLTTTDAASVRYLFTRMDMDPLDVLSIEDASTPEYPVLDTQLVGSMSANFASTIIGTSTIDDVMNGRFMQVNERGILAIA